MIRTTLSSFVLLFATSTIGCGMLVQQPGAGAPQGGATSPKVVIPKESQDQIREGERKAYADADDRDDEELDRREKEALKALRVALGKEKWAEHLGEPLPASTNVKELRAAKVKMKITAVTDQDGKAVSQDFLQLKDEATDRLGILSRKMAEGKATAAEKKKMQDYSKHSFKLMDLRMQVMNVSMVTMQSNVDVQMKSLMQMLRVSGLVRSRKLYEMEFDAQDYELVKRGLQRQKRAEAIAATTMATLATYQAVINDGGDPKALDVIAEAALKAFPIKAEVTDADAKAYVEGLSGNVGKVKERYEAWMRQAHGDAKYEKQYKAGIDAMFKQAEDAGSQKSVNEIASDSNAQYRADIEKCKRGEDPGPGSMAGGPTCKAVYKAAQTGDTSALLPGVRKTFEETGGANAGGQSAKLVGGKAGQGLAVGQAAANGDVAGALDGAAQMFPADGTIGASLKGISALSKGDPKGAINAALSFVPVPGLKDAFGFASKMLFKG
jgi:hypothetical protein